MEDLGARGPHWDTRIGGSCVVEQSASTLTWVQQSGWRGRHCGIGFELVLDIAVRWGKEVDVQLDVSLQKIPTAAAVDRTGNSCSSGS